jgi:hypothetical protein
LKTQGGNHNHSAYLTARIARDHPEISKRMKEFKSVSFWPYKDGRKVAIVMRARSTRQKAGILHDRCRARVVHELREINHLFLSEERPFTAQSLAARSETI